MKLKNFMSFLNLTMAAYASVLIAALSFDLRTDRSFGATILATILIAAIAGVCLLVGPWLAGSRRVSAVKCWAAGAAIVGITTFGFACLGPEQARTGEMIFAYSSMLLAAPISILIPIAYSLIGDVLPDSPAIRITLVFLALSFLAFAQWRFFTLVRAVFRRGNSGDTELPPVKAKP